MPWESVRSDTFEKADCSTIDFHSIRELVMHTNTPRNKLYEAVACNLAMWKLHAITHPQYYQNGATTNHPQMIGSWDWVHHGSPWFTTLLYC